MASDPRSVPKPRWRPGKPRTLAALAALALLAVAAVAALRPRPDRWPARAVLAVPGRAYPLAMSPDGRTLLTSGLGGITPWDLATGRRGPAWESKEGFFAPEGAYSPDARTFAAVIFHHPRLASVELVDPATGRTRATLATGHPKVYGFGFDADGRTFRALLGDGASLKEVATWDVETGRPASSRAVTAPTRRAHAAASPDGRLLAFCHAGSKAVRLWDLEADAAVAGLPAAPGGATTGPALAWSADGRALASGRGDGAVDLWDVAARQHLKTLPAHPVGYAPWKVRFAPDGRTLASTAFPSAPRSALVQALDDLSGRLIGSSSGGAAELVVVDIPSGRRAVRSTSAMFLFYSGDGRGVATRTPDLEVQVRDLPVPE